MRLNCSISDRLPHRRLWRKPRTFVSLAVFATWAARAFNDKTLVEVIQDGQTIAFVEVINTDTAQLTEVPY